MHPYHERQAAFKNWWARVRAFRKDRSFPTDWAKVVAGVGLVSFSMRVEQVLSNMSMMYCFTPQYLHDTGQAEAVTHDLDALLREFDRFLPSLPPEPRSYFEDVRALVNEALQLAGKHWAIPGADTVRPA